MKALDLGSKNVFSTVLKLTLPAMLAQFINVLYSVVDRMYVGNIQDIGGTVLAGVGVCAPISTLITSFAYLIGLGGAPLFAMSLGEGYSPTRSFPSSPSPFSYPYSCSRCGAPC